MNNAYITMKFIYNALKSAFKCTIGSFKLIIEISTNPRRDVSAISSNKGKLSNWEVGNNTLVNKRPCIIL